MLLAAICTALLIALNPSNAHGCTSWMVFSDFTKNGTNILHKNRDATPRIITVFRSAPTSPRKWVALGSPGYTNMGINTSGLAGVMNSGEICVDPPNVVGKKSTPQMMQAVLESCDTAAQAVNKLKELIAAGDYSHGKKGSIFFFLDRNEGYICEITGKYCSAQRYDNGYAVRANIWQNPGMYQLSRNNIKGHLNSSARAYIAISGLNAIMDKHGKIALLDIFDLSRHYLMPEKSTQPRSVCFKLTNSTASLEVDKQYPDVLSTMYATIGHPRHTVYVPVPVCAEKFLPSMESPKWSAAVFKRLDALKLEAPIPAEWTKFEQDSMAEYTKAKAEARKLLDAGKRAEAIKLVNSAAEKIWIAAEKLLKI